MRARKGFTLIEIMISITILLVIMGAAIQFMRRQANAVGLETQRMDALQNAEFAASQIERELREAGAGVTDAQPVMVQLDSLALTFNANMVSIDPADVRAVYRNEDADSTAVRAMLQSERMALPTSSPARMYPETTYWSGRGVTSGAETISYYLVKDATASTSNTYTLYRRVNALPATLIARNLVRSAADSIPFFTYYTVDTTGNYVAIPRSRFPLYHDTIHNSVSDTASSALTDSVRMVRLHFVALTLDRRAKRDSIKYRSVETRVRLMNAGLLQLSSCGSQPFGVSAPSVSQASPTPNTRTVTVTWSKSRDDGGGEKDIERYAIFRRDAAATQLGDPFASVPASGSATYSFTDSDVVPGASYVYGIAAQDCTPKVSDAAVSPSITVNP